MSGKRSEEMSDSGMQAHTDDAEATRATILVIDDDDAVRHLLREVLELHGYQVVTAATVKEADASLQQLTPRAVALVITDIHLTADPQGLEGYEIYRRWTAVHPSLPFLLISGDPVGDTLSAVQAGNVPFLSKPFTLDQLIDIVRTLLGG